MFETPEELAARIMNWCREQPGRTGGHMSARTFGLKHFNNSHLVARLEDGKQVHLKTYAAIIDLIGPPQKASA